MVEIHILKRAEIFVFPSLHSHSLLITDGRNISPLNVVVNVTLNESLNDNHQSLGHPRYKVKYWMIFIETLIKSHIVALHVFNVSRNEDRQVLKYLSLDKSIL